MKLFRMAALFLLVTGPAYAQMPSMNMMPSQPDKTMEQIEQEKAQEKAYKDTLKTMPDAKAPTDPWGNVRSDAPKSAATKSATPPKAKAKTQARTDTKTEAQTPALTKQ